VGRAQGRPGHRLLPPGEAAQARGAARRRVHGCAASPSRFVAPRRAGPARSRFC